MSTNLATNNYILGHTDPELARLIRQANFWADHTRAFLQQAGLRPGMRVLDLGSGAGDVSFLAASLVGPSGAVLGIERAPEAIGRARLRAEKAGLHNVKFIQTEITTFTPDEPVDAVIGRLIIMYLPDPVHTLHRLAGFVRRGGIVAFQEIDMVAACSEPVSSIFDQGMNWIQSTFKAAGIPIRLGLQLPLLFRQAGLPQPQTMVASRIASDADSPGYEYFAETVRTLLPLMQRLSIASPEEVQIDTLAERVRVEVIRQNGVIVTPSLIGAYAKLPA